MGRRRAITDTPPECYTIPEFCCAHRIGRTFYYKLRKQGLAPLEIRVGNKRLIPKKPAANWRATINDKAARARAAEAS